MSFDHGLQQGETIDNRRLSETFQCGTQGGMRRSLTTNTLVLVSDHTKTVYQDRWDTSEVLRYTGMGLTGDQSLDKQNKTLAESPQNGVEVYLFEVLEKGAYWFRGQVELAEEPYQETQADKNGDMRRVWIFPLILSEKDQAVLLPLGVIKKNEERKGKSASRLTDAELQKRIELSSGWSQIRRVSTTYYERNQNVVEMIKRTAGGHCQLCGKPALFKDRYGRPYLESHHIEWLSKGGSDSVENTVALYPNCHRKMHVLNLESDKDVLRQRALKVYHQATHSLSQ
jgi:5-methylcytosine-specific restriction protein A